MAQTSSILNYDISYDHWKKGSPLWNIKLLISCVCTQSIWGSFTTNHCTRVVIHGGVQLGCSFGSDVSPSWKYSTNSLRGSSQAGELTARSNTGSCFGALRPKRKRKLASLLTLDLIEHTGPTTTGTIKQTNPSDCGNIKDFSLCLSILAPDLDLQIKCKLYVNEKRTVQIFFSSGQAKTLLMWSQAQEYLECDRCASCPKDVCVAALYGTTSPFVKFYRSWINLSWHHCFLQHFSQLSINMLPFGTLWTASLFSSDLQWLNLIMEGTDGHHLSR